MNKQHIIGFIGFKDKINKKIERKKIEDFFKVLNEKDLNITYFENLIKDNCVLNLNGFFLSGKININYSSENIIEIFKKFEKEINIFDISIENEDKINLYSNFINLKNLHYFGIKISMEDNKDNDVKKVEELALKLSKELDLNLFIIRSAEKNTKGNLVFSIDFIYEKIKENFNETISSLILKNNFKKESIVILNF